MSGTAFKDEVERVASYVDKASEYVETRIDELGTKISEVLAEGLSYDIKILKDGVEVHSVPSAVAGALTAISFLPPARLLAMAGLAGANLSGYTFRLYKRPAKK